MSAYPTLFYFIILIIFGEITINLFVVEFSPASGFSPLSLEQTFLFTTLFSNKPSVLVCSSLETVAYIKGNLVEQ
jgi:hypothetical protein